MTEIGRLLEAIRNNERPNPKRRMSREEMEDKAPPKPEQAQPEKLEQPE